MVYNEIGDKGYVDVTGNGTKTWRQCLNELYALIDINKMSHKSYLQDLTSQIMYPFNRYYQGIYYFSAVFYTSAADIECYLIHATSSAGVNTVLQANKYPTSNDFSTAVVANGRTLRIYYS